MRSENNNFTNQDSQDVLDQTQENENKANDSQGDLKI